MEKETNVEKRWLGRTTKPTWKELQLIWGQLQLIWGCFFLGRLWDKNWQHFKISRASKKKLAERSNALGQISKDQDWVSRRPCGSWQPDSARTKCDQLSPKFKGLVIGWLSNGQPEMGCFGLHLIWVPNRLHLIWGWKNVISVEFDRNHPKSGLLGGSSAGFRAHPNLIVIHMV